MKFASAIVYTFLLLISPLMICALVLSLPLTGGRSWPALKRMLEGRF